MFLTPLFTCFVFLTPLFTCFVFLTPLLTCFVFLTPLFTCSVFLTPLFTCSVFLTPLFTCFELVLPHCSGVRVPVARLQQAQEEQHCPVPADGQTVPPLQGSPSAQEHWPHSPAPGQVPVITVIPLCPNRTNSSCIAKISILK